MRERYSQKRFFRNRYQKKAKLKLKCPVCPRRVFSIRTHLRMTADIRHQKYWREHSL
jgi:hypothetical protein